MGVEKKIKQIMAIGNLEKRGEALREYAQSLGVSLASTQGPLIFLEDEVVRRIREAARSQREEKLWIVAVAAAIAASFSAVASWCAVLKK